MALLRCFFFRNSLTVSQRVRLFSSEEATDQSEVRFGAEGLVNINRLVELAKSGTATNKQVTALDRAILPEISTYNSITLARLATYRRKLSPPPSPALLEKVEQRTLELCRSPAKFDPSSISNLVTGLSKMTSIFQPSFPMLRALERKCHAQLCYARFDPHDLANVVRGWLPFSNHRLSSSFLQTVEKEAKERINEFNTPLLLSNLATGISQTGYYRPTAELLAAIVHRSTPILNDFKPLELCNLLYCMANTEHWNKRIFSPRTDFLEAICARSIDLMPSFFPLELKLSISSFCFLQECFTPPIEYSDAIIKQLTAMLYRFDEAGVFEYLTMVSQPPFGLVLEHMEPLEKQFLRSSRSRSYNFNSHLIRRLYTLTVPDYSPSSFFLKQLDIYFRKHMKELSFDDVNAILEGYTVWGVPPPEYLFEKATDQKLA